MDVGLWTLNDDKSTKYFDDEFHGSKMKMSFKSRYIHPTGLCENITSSTIYINTYMGILNNIVYWLRLIYCSVM